MKKPPDSPVIVLLRRDLRLTDNPALLQASKADGPVLPVLLPEVEGNRWAAGRLPRLWHLRNAKALHGALDQRYGNGLQVLEGDWKEALRRLAVSVGARKFIYNAGFDPPSVSQDREVEMLATELAIESLACPTNLLLPIGSIRNKEGGSFKVFTPFYKRFLQEYRHLPPDPAPDKLPPVHGMTDNGISGFADLALDANAGYVEALRGWEPGEQAALRRLDEFIRDGLGEYGSDRHSLEISGTSRISAWLQAGVISVRSVWDRVQAAMDADPGMVEGGTAFLRQLVWREFCVNVMADNPRMAELPLREQFADFPWMPDERSLQAWQDGQTGYPVVDAAMRQLKREGWMPGRARMVVASFLVKHLLLHWHDGEDWFREWLVDYDLACNAFNWQWVAGCGADAAPYFRIFNPILQGRKFDSDGSYVREWVPELAGLTDERLHSPWEASPLELQAAGIVLGRDYPMPIVEHSAARERALDALKSVSA